MTDTPGEPAAGYPDPDERQPAGDQAAGRTAPPTPPPAPPVAEPTSGGAGGFNSSALHNFDPKTVNPLDWAIMGAGVVTFLLSFFGYYKYTVKIEIGALQQTTSTTWSAWGHGFFGWFAGLVALASAALLAAHLIAKVELPFPVRPAVLGGFGLALVCALLALIVVPGPSYSGPGFSLSKGHGLSYWLSLIILIAGTGLAFVRYQQTEGKAVGNS
jgi:hypothetical protein